VQLSIPLMILIMDVIHLTTIRMIYAKWESIIREFHPMFSKGVCNIDPFCSIPHGRNLAVNRLVYTEKEDGTFRSRTDAEGFSQVPG
jgi:hypothetical protein